MLIRDASDKIKELASYFKAVAVTGPRQSGKTTLVKHLFPDKKYISLENPDSMRFAIEDPRSFLASYPNGAILDEVQRVPELFSYLQEILDNSVEKGLFILTGSNNFLLNQHISQSLSGRVGFMNLLPFSISELHSPHTLPSLDVLLYQGFYPPVHDQNIPANVWYANYIRTYIERDVRQIKNITDLIVFDRFIRLLAGRLGQELNMTALSNEVGVDVKTIQAWIGVLESSFLIYLLKPYFRNFNKTIIKRPKIYFYDVGLAISLLGMNDINQLEYHPLKGSIFENMLVMDLLKQKEHGLSSSSMYYWRDKTGHEIDLLIENGTQVLPIEIKMGQTLSNDHFKNLLFWMKLSQVEKGLLLYNGDAQSRSNGVEVKNWKEMVRFFQKN